MRKIQSSIKEKTTRFSNRRKENLNQINFNEKENFRLYLCKSLNISLSEAKLLESEIKNYIKIKRNKQQLDEISWKDVKDFGKKAIAGTLLVSASFMPIAQSLYGSDSCTVNESGQEVSCDISKAQEKLPVKEVLSFVKWGIDRINKNIETPNYKYHDLTDGEIKAVVNKLNQLDKRPNLTKEEKIAIQGMMKSANEMQNKFERVNPNTKTKELSNQLDNMNNSNSDAQKKLKKQSKAQMNKLSGKDSKAQDDIENSMDGKFDSLNKSNNDLQNKLLKKASMR